MDRASFLSAGARSGAVVALGAISTGLLAGNAPAQTADGPLTDLDLALVRLAVGAEILAAAFCSEAIASKKFGAERRVCFLRPHDDRGARRCKRDAAPERVHRVRRHHPVGISFQVTIDYMTASDLLDAYLE